MQPVRIGFNATLVLILLLLAVPIQLLLNHYLHRSYNTRSIVEKFSKGPSAKGFEEAIRKGTVKVEDEETEGLDEAREEAMERLSTSVLNLVDLIRHYSSWQNLKELFIIPHKRRMVKDRTAIHLGSLESQSSNNIKMSTSSSNKHSRSQFSSSKTTKTGTSGVKVKPKKSKIEEVAPTSRAKEVEEYMMRKVYFGQSETPRTSRPSTVHFFVGQVVKHKVDGYYGVIIGWDREAKAPDWWLDKFYAANRKHVIRTPHYHILLDTHFNASGTPYHYIPEEDLEQVDTDVQISAPELSKYFEGYKNHRHTPRPWLRERYPMG